MPEGEEVQDLNANGQDEEMEPVDHTGEEAEEVEQPEAATEVAETPEPQTERPTWTMPVAKAQEEKAKAVEKARAEAKAEADAEIARVRQEYEQKITEVAPKPSYQEKLNKVAAEYNLDPEAAGKLLDVLREDLKGSLPDYSKYDEIIKEREIEGFKSQASREFDEKVLPLIQKDYPNATPQHIADVKARVSELAFSEGYNTYRIEDIYRVKRDEFTFKNGFSAEASGGRSSELTDFSKMTDAEEHELSERDPATYAKYLKEMERKHSRYLD